MQQISSVREQFASRAGFILMTAGCAIGLGNVWRFSYIAGQYGGGFFMLLYLFFLVVLGFPVMLMELSLGRSSRSTYPGAFRNLQQPGSRFPWHKPAYLLFSGNLILLMFYTVITGWLLIYSCKFLSGTFRNIAPEKCPEIFNTILENPWLQTIGTLAALIMTFAVCVGGVRKTIEKVIKVMMAGLFLLLGMLVLQSLQLPDAANGLKYFLQPDWNKFVGDGIFATVHAAMAQAFFTLSLGIGSIAVCGSYMNSNNSLVREGVWIIVLDTIVAVASGLIIFPACASFNISPDSGPPLIFITLPHIFDSMPCGVLWGTLFFVFLAIAALSTLIAVFENLVAFGMDEWKWTRKFSCTVFGIILMLASLPCIFGFNLWKNFQPLGKNSNILDLEDFIVSDNLLPLGALYLTLFCLTRYGWGRKNFFAAVNSGSGAKLPEKLAPWLLFILPAVILCIWVAGLIIRFK